LEGGHASEKKVLKANVSGRVLREQVGGGNQRNKSKDESRQGGVECVARVTRREVTNTGKRGR